MVEGKCQHGTFGIENFNLSVETWNICPLCFSVFNSVAFVVYSSLYIYKPFILLYFFQAPKKMVRYHGNQVVTTKGERYHMVKKEEAEDMKKTYVNLKPARKYRFHWPASNVSIRFYDVSIFLVVFLRLTTLWLTALTDLVIQSFIFVFLCFDLKCIINHF